MKCGLLTIAPANFLMTVPAMARPSGADIQLWIPDIGCLTGANLGRPHWRQNSEEPCSLETFEHIKTDFSATVSHQYAEIPDTEIQTWLSVLETGEEKQITALWPNILQRFQD